MKKRFLICSVVPKELVSYIHASQAANNFCYNLIDNIKFDEVHSIWPPSYQTKEYIKDINIKYYINKSSNNKYKVFYKFIVNNILLAIRTHKATHIWFYNLCNVNVIAYLIIKYILRKKVYIILADHTPSKKKISIQHFFEYLINKSDGILKLSSRSDIYHKSMNEINLAGIIPNNKISNIVNPLNAIPKFLFSGTLSPITGFDMVLEVFKNIPEVDLYISGPGIMPLQYKDYNNIHFLGMLKYQDYIELFSKIDICLNFRNPNLPENNNNFPSKVLEYFSKNKVVMSTIDYPELADFKYIKVPFNKEDIINKVNYILSNRIDLKYYQDNRQALKNNFSEIKWKEAINNIENYNL